MGALQTDRPTDRQTDRQTESLVEEHSLLKTIPTIFHVTPLGASNNRHSFFFFNLTISPFKQLPNWPLVNLTSLNELKTNWPLVKLTSHNELKTNWLLVNLTSHNELKILMY